MIEKINSVLWGDFTLLLIFLCGIYHTARNGFIQFRLHSAIGSGNGGKNRMKAVTSALAASMGTGNITGCAAAIAAGGAGSVFWMWLSAFFGMALAYAENVTGAHFAEKYRSPASPALYIEKGLGSKLLARLYCIGCLGCAFAMGCSSQSGALCSAVCSQTGTNAIIPAAAVTLLTALVIFSSERASEGIMKVTEKAVPVMGIAYGGGCIALLVLTRADISGAFGDIFSSAFTPQAALGGAAGITVKKAVSVGLRRGVFSNEAGMGSSVLVHSEADFGSPEAAGAWAALEVFLDTIVCCTLTALAVLTSDLYKCGEFGITEIFSHGLGNAGGIFTCASICMFAWASMLGWCCCGEKSLSSLTKSRSAAFIYKLLFCAAALTGGILPQDTVMGFADLCNAFVLIPNIIAVTVISICKTDH